MPKAKPKTITPTKRARPNPIATPRPVTKVEPAEPSHDGDFTAEQRAEAAEQPYRARAFDELENQVYALTLAARLAEAQVDRAVDEFESEMGKRDLPEADLAIHAVSSLLDRAKGLEDQWIRLHNEACLIGRAAAYDVTA